MKCVLLVLLLAFVQPSWSEEYITFTREQFDELQETLDQLENLNVQDKKTINDLKTTASHLKKTTEQLQRSYKKQKIYWIVGSTLTVISVGLIGYEIGVHRAR